MSSLRSRRTERHSAWFQVAPLRGRLTTNDPKFFQEFQNTFFERAPARGPAHVSYAVHVDREFALTKKHSVTRNGELLLVTAFYPSLLSAIDRDVSETLLRSFPRYRFVRAGMVALNGQGTLFLSESGSDSAWLIKALVDRGAQLLSDAMTILDYPRRSAIPYPKAIALNHPAHPLLPKSAKPRDFRSMTKQT